jgi:hypothetical protein
MVKVGSTLYWRFVILPCRNYKAMGSAGGSVPYPAILVMLGAAVAGGGSVWAIAAAAGTSGSQALTVGPIVGLAACGVWLIYTAVVVGVLKAQGKDHSAMARQRAPRRRGPV